MKKKVLLAVTKSSWGGAGRYVFDIATNLPKSKYEIVVVCGGSGKLFQKLEEEKITVHSLSKLGRDVSLSSDTSSFFSIFSIIKKERPDIIHLNSPKIAGLGALAGRILGVKKIVYTNHGWTFNEDRNFFQKTLIKIFSWLIVLLSHKTIVLSQKECAQVNKWPFLRNKLEIVPIGIKPGSSLPKEEAFLKLQHIIGKPIDKNKTIVGSIGELHQNKGYEYAITAISKMKNLEYIIISDGEEKEKLQKMIKKLGATNIHLAGQIDNASTLLKAFDIFLLPSIKEGLPYVLLEAGDAEVPIISTNVGGIPELIEDKFSGILINPKSPEEISLAINTLLTDGNNQSLIYAENLKRTIERGFLLLPILNKIDTLYSVE